MTAARTPPPSAGDAGDTRRMLWRFAPMIYGPTLLFALGEGALLPMLPVIASAMGADLAQAALVAAVIVVAQLLGNIPAGWAVSRIGERRTMSIAGLIALAGVIGVILAPDVAALAASVFGIGLCASAFGLARHAFMTTRVPLPYRARALSVLGGSFRLGMFLGPFVAALLLTLFGSPLAAGWFFAACLVGLILLVALGRDPEEQLAREGHLGRSSGRESVRDAVAGDTGEATTGAIPLVERRGVLRTAWRFRSLLMRLGLSAATMAAVRQARIYGLPLWAVSLGLDAQAISLIVGLSGALEFALFYSSGQIMDRFGRLWAALPSMLLMSLAFVGLSFTHDLPSATTWFIVGAAVVGIGNGLSSGILLTLGADSAPPDDPAPFLGAWRTLTDAGGASAPLLLAAITAAAGLPFAFAAVGAIGLIGAGGFARFIPRFVPRR